jgi:hypothetical protein
MRDKFDKPVVGNLFFKEDLFDSHKFTFSQKKIIWCLLRGIYDYYIEIDEKKVIICSFSDLAHMASLKEVTTRLNVSKLIKNNIITCEKLLGKHKDTYGTNTCFWVNEEVLKDIIYGDRKMVFDRFGGKIVKKGVSRRLTNLENLVLRQTELLEKLCKKY